MTEAPWCKNLPMAEIYAAALAHKLDADLVTAIVMTESGGRSWLPRYEPNYRWLYFPREICEKVGVSLDTMRMLQMTSWGPMQVMGAVAYELGFPQNKATTELCQPAVGIDYGCRLLARHFGRYNAEEQVIAAYNAGSARMKNGLFENQRYVDKVYGYLRELRKLI